MKKFLSVFFNIDKTYVTFMHPTKKGLELDFIGSTYQHIDLQKIEHESLKYQLVELRDLLAALEIDDNTRISVSIPVDLALVSQFPGKSDITNEELKLLVNLEIKQNYPQFNYEDFISNVYHLENHKEGSNNLMAVIVAKTDLKACKKALEFLNRPIDNIEISHINSHSSYLYNYPERHSETAIFFGIQQNFTDVSTIARGNHLYYNLLSTGNKEQFKNICSNEIEKILGSIAEKIDSGYIFGTGLNDELLGKFVEVCQNFNIVPQKLNAFRMVTTKLDVQMRQYCSEMAHIYPPCVGGCFTGYFDRIKFY